MMSTTRLSQFGFLIVNGRDARTFLQGYTTCDVESSEIAVGAICNLQGKMLTNFRLHGTDDELVLRMHHSLVQPTISFLSKYIVFSKAELADASDIWSCYGVVGESGASGLKIPVSDSRQELWTQEACSEQNPDLDAWLDADIQDGFAWVDQDSTEKYLPQMFNLHSLGAIDFEKGCYLGQEIVARAQYRGELKRQLHRSTVSSRLEPGSEVADVSGRVIGQIVASSTLSALAVIQNSSQDALSGSCDGRAVTFHPLS